MGRNEKHASLTAEQKVVSEVEQRRAADDEATRQADAERQVTFDCFEGILLSSASSSEGSMGGNSNLLFALVLCATPCSKP